MTCSRALSFDELVAYWARDLADDEVDRIDEHLMGCATCSAESARVAAIAEALRALVPPTLTRAELERQRASGLRIDENTFAPGERKSVAFAPGVDLLIHRLTGLDLSRVERVGVSVRAESTGETLLEVPIASFEPSEGVLVACHRHYSEFPPDTVFEVRARDASGAERTAVYTILHVFPE